MIDRINAMSAEDFVATFGFLFEHSPWVVEGAAALRPFADKPAMFAAFDAVLANAGEAGQLALIRAHPELAGKAALAGELTAESAMEQASVGLDRLTQQEFDLFHALNAAYRDRFDFPFIICVRLTNKAGILAAMEARLAHDRDTEMATALTEIGKIVRLRLEEIWQ